MAKKLVLVDTSVLIDFFRKSNKANSRLLKMVRDDFSYCISALTEFEIYTGTTPNQTAYWEDFLFRTQVLAFDKEIARTAVDISKALRNKVNLSAWQISLSLPRRCITACHWQR